MTNFEKWKQSLTIENANIFECCACPASDFCDHFEEKNCNDAFRAWGGITEGVVWVDGTPQCPECKCKDIRLGNFYHDYCLSCGEKLNWEIDRDISTVKLH